MNPDFVHAFATAGELSTHNVWSAFIHNTWYQTWNICISDLFVMLQSDQGRLVYKMLLAEVQALKSFCPLFSPNISPIIMNRDTPLML